MDGVLIDAKDWHYSALNKALHLFGMEISRHDHLSSFDGLPTKTKLEMLSIDRGLPRDLHPFINQLKQQYTVNEVFDKCKPYFPHEYALSRLKSDGYLLAVCSNSIKKTIEIMLEKAMIFDYFDAYLSNEDVKRPKPSPEIYSKCMHKLGVLPSETLILEDNEHGKKAAIDSGAHLLEIDTVHDVTYFNIENKIKEIIQRKNA